MATIKSFEDEDIEAWQKARSLSKEIFELTNVGTFSRDFGLRDQINRASGSIMDNIAEGFERSGTKEFIQFLAIAKGSAGEVLSQLYRALDRNHLTKEQYNILAESTKQISKMINGFMIYLRDTNLKGMKFH
jgi:four helix bundle protein